jgi:hypothetical protein
MPTQDPQIFNIPFDFPFLFRPLLHAQNYLWCRANPTLKVSIFGLLTIPTSRRWPCSVAPSFTLTVQLLQFTRRP